MSAVTGLTLGGTTWIPDFIQSIDWSKCLGCGRCLKVCGRNVLELRAMNDEGDFVDEDDDDDEVERKVMVVANADDCIGCGACARICSRQCHVHGTADLN